MKITRNLFVWLLAIGLSGGASSSRGQLLFQHSGSTNPTNEGFALLSYGNPTLEPVNDAGTSAWAIRMLHTDAAHYRHRLTAQEQTQVPWADWTLTCTMRVLQAPTEPTYDISAGFHSGTLLFSLYFGMAANGDPMVQVRQNDALLSPVITVTGASSTYNTYALKYDTDTDSADLWINGTEVYSDIVAPHWSAAPVFGWSGYQHPNDVQVNWSLVSLEIVPEPSTFTIVLLGGCIMLGRHRRQRG